LIQTSQASFISDSDFGKIDLRHKRIPESSFYKLQNNGPGVPMRIKNCLSEPFTTFGKKDGAGLGLTLSKRVVEAHGGSIQLTEREEGAEFRILLPKKG
jgi:two-component system sensor histidine kinase AtoS